MKKNKAGIYITKRNGEQVLFDPEKLKQALHASGAEETEQEKITEIVIQNLYDGIPSSKIYSMALDLLKKKSHSLAGRYKLKNAIIELGPTGFPFECFVGRIFKTNGYDVEIGVTVQGKCVQHEIDVIARKPGEMLMIECKFHRDSLSKNSVQIPLYIHSRFIDVKTSWEEQYGKNINYRGGLVTNTRFSYDAQSYGDCAGLLMISWDYPYNNGLKNLIDKSGLHPLTSLISLTKAQKQKLLEKGIVLCSELEPNVSLLYDMKISEQQITKILREAQNLVNK
jgi:hypothetical protein